MEATQVVVIFGDGGFGDMSHWSLRLLHWSFVALLWPAVTLFVLTAIDVLWPGLGIAKHILDPLVYYCSQSLDWLW